MIQMSGFRGMTLGAAASILFASSVAAQEAETGVCEKQLDADVASRFGQKITKIDWELQSSDDSRGANKGQAVVYTDGCPGFHVYDIFGKEFDCFDRVHHGEARNYIQYRTSAEGC